MTNNQQRRLTDGRLVNSAIGSNNSKLGGNQSNYLVSNDGVQTMDLPRNMLGPRKAEPSNRATPLLIPPLKYIVYNNPQVVYDFLISKSYNVEPSIPSTYQFARIFVKENGDPGILELVKAAHPDAALILKAMGHKEDSSFCCGFNGDNNAPEAKTSTTENTTSTTGTSEREPAPKSESKAEEWIKLNTKTIIIILVIVVFFLIINRTTKAA